MLVAGNLKIMAGEAAYASIRKNGFDPARVKVVVAAAGGPKWLVLSRMDRVVFDLLSRPSQPRTDPLYLIGASIGAWRMTSLARADPVAAIKAFEDDYLAYDWGDQKLSAEQVMARSWDTLDMLLPGDGAIDEILNHPFMRLSVMAVRSRGIVGTERRVPLTAAMLAVLAANMVSRRSLGMFFQRALFSDPRDAPPFADANEFPIIHTPMSRANLRGAVMAASSIPIVMTGVSGIEGAPAGTYRDGGFIDYHFDLPFLGTDDPDADDIALYPHYRSRLVPGWFDKSLKRRKPSKENYRHALVIAPSDEFIAALPGGKLPDRGDFKLYPFAERQKIWRGVVSESQRLADELADLLATRKLAERMERLPL